MKKAKRKKINYAKGWETRRRNAALRAKQEVQQNGGHTQSFSQGATLGQRHGQRIPGHGEIVGGSNGMEEAAKRIAKMARRNDLGEIAAELNSLVFQAASDAHTGRDRAYLKRIQDIREGERESAVCNFVAEFDSMQRAYGGLPPDMVLHVGARTAIRLVDALNLAGYSASGYSAPAQQPKAD